MKSGTRIAIEMASLLDQGVTPSEVMEKYSKTISKKVLSENFYNHFGTTINEYNQMNEGIFTKKSKPKVVKDFTKPDEPKKKPAEKPRDDGKPYVTEKNTNESEELVKIIDSQPRLRKDKDLFIKNYSRGKLYELFNQMAISGLGYEPDMANDICTQLVQQLIPNEPEVGTSGAYVEPEVVNPPIQINTSDAKLTDNPKTLPELSKFIEVLIQHYGDMKQSLTDLLQGACDNLQAQGEWDASSECYECHLASDEAKMIVGDLKHEIMEQIYIYEKPMPERNTKDAAKLIYEWMKDQSISLKTPLSEGFNDAETKYWKIRLDAIKEWESKLGTRSVDWAWKQFVKKMDS